MQTILFFEVDLCRSLDSCITSSSGEALAFDIYMFAPTIWRAPVSILNSFSFLLKRVIHFWLTCFGWNISVNCFLTEKVNVYIETTSTGVTNPDVSICIAA